MAGGRLPGSRPEAFRQTVRAGHLERGPGRWPQLAAGTLEEAAPCLGLRERSDGLLRLRSEGNSTASCTKDSDGTLSAGSCAGVVVRPPDVPQPLPPGHEPGGHLLHRSPGCSPSDRAAGRAHVHPGPDDCLWHPGHAGGVEPPFGTHNIPEPAEIPGPVSGTGAHPGGHGPAGTADVRRGGCEPGQRSAAAPGSRRCLGCCLAGDRFRPEFLSRIGGLFFRQSDTAGAAVPVARDRAVVVRTGYGAAGADVRCAFDLQRLVGRQGVQRAERGGMVGSARDRRMCWFCWGFTSPFGRFTDCRSDILPA